MDEDPFSFFITPATAEVPKSMSAALMNTESLESRQNHFCSSLARRWAHSVRAGQRHDAQRSAPDQSSRDNPHPKYGHLEIREPRAVDSMDSQALSIPTIVITQWNEDTTQDRTQQLRTEIKRLRRRRRTSRTLSGHRHSWQAPSPDLYTVMEEGYRDEVAVESASDEDFMDSDEEDEELDSEDEALYAEDDDIELGWGGTTMSASREKARL